MASSTAGPVASLGKTSLSSFGYVSIPRLRFFFFFLPLVRRIHTLYHETLYTNTFWGEITWLIAQYGTNVAFLKSYRHVLPGNN